jgi:periplasmic protein TonB
MKMLHARLWQAAAACALTLLAACGEVPRAHPPPASIMVTPPAGRAPAPAPHISYASVDEYKMQVARQIVRMNPAFVFSGHIKPLLPAIVVLDIGIDKDGNMAHVKVHRSRSDHASVIAMAAVRRSAPFPVPHNLVRDVRQPLVFSETFLFNDDYRFQIRSLAPPQD